MPMEKRKEELKRNSINVHQRLGTDAHITAEEMDDERRNTKAYEYLCRLEEAKTWIGKIANVPESYEEFEDEMRKGLYLAEVAKFYSPSSVKSIFIDDTLQYRHTDNINFFLTALKDLGLPRYFFFEVIDLYEKKNFPKVVYCIHALAHYLSSKGIAGGIKSARGKVFNKSDIDRIDSELDSIRMPSFDKIKKDMDTSLKYEEDVKKQDSVTVTEQIKEEDEDFESLMQKAREELLKADQELSTDSSDDKSFEVEFKISDEERLGLKFESFLYSKAFEDIYYRKNVSLFSIRKFLFVFFKASVEMLKENAIDELHRKINKKLREIYNKELYLDDVENRIKLIIENKVDLYKAVVKRSPVKEVDLKPMQIVLQYLQTNASYLSLLLQNEEDLDTFITSTVIPLFSHVSGKKEEYLFINLVLEVFKKELINSGVDITGILSCEFYQSGSSPLSVSSYNHFSRILFNNYGEVNHHNLGNSSIAYKLMLNFFRSSKECEVFRSGLYAIVKNLDNIDIEANPTVIYESLFDRIEPLDVALENEKVNEIVETRLMVIRGVLSSIIDFIEANVDSIPYILRYFMRVYGHKSFFFDFISPFIIAPDAFNPDIVISKSLRRKIYTISKLLSFVIEHADYFANYSTEDFNENPVQYGRDPGYDVLRNSEKEQLFEATFYEPIFPFFKMFAEKYNEILELIVNVSSLDQYFQLESMNELVRVQKTMVYLPVKVANDLIVSLKNNIMWFDPIFSEYVSSLELLPDESNITLAFSILNSDIVNQTDEEEIALDNFLRNTKKKLIYLIKICKGRNIYDVLLRESCEEEKEFYNRLKDEELSQIVRIYKDNGAIVEDEMLSQITLPPQFIYEDVDELKEGLLDDLKFLEEKGITYKNNLYSELLSMLAHDIVVLRFMSQERSRELKVNEMTYSNLLSKEEYLEVKIHEYDKYINSYSQRMVVKNVKKYEENSPIRSMKKESTYGSYYFTAEQLKSMGILNQLYDVPDVRDIFFVILSEKPLVFSLEVYINKLLISNPYNFRLEDILMIKKNKQESFDVLGICSFNTEEFIKLLNENYVAV